MIELFWIACDSSAEEHSRAEAASMCGEFNHNQPLSVQMGPCSKTTAIKMSYTLFSGSEVKIKASLRQSYYQAPETLLSVCWWLTHSFFLLSCAECSLSSITVDV